jgi:serine/threonine protein kinase
MQDSGGGDLIGQSLGDYLLRDVLGLGGMAEVYRAMDLVLEREVAVKVLSASLAADEGYVRRFREEAQRVAALQHPHIVPIYAFGEDHGRFYHVMPVLERSLRDRLQKDGRLPAAEAVRLVRQIAAALGAAHTLGLLHRDVKPENILLDVEGNALLTDFGIARQIVGLSQVGVARTLARTGMLMGTPEYMAPEQLRAEPCDQRADVYALGAVLYELLTGVAPHEAASPFEVAALALSAPIIPPSQRNHQVWPALERVVLKALARDAAERYPDMQSFSNALELALHHTAAPENRPTLPLSPRSTRRLTPPQGMPVRRAAVLALATLLLVGVAGSTLAFMGRGTTTPITTNGSDGGGLGPGSETATVGMTSVTATTSAQPTQTPNYAPTAASQPSPSPSPTPAPTLIMRPTPLILKPDPQKPDTCVATQTITNTTHQTVGWQWLQPQGGFQFRINGGPQLSWPKDTQPGIPPGGTHTLTATSKCPAAPKLYGILMTDTLGDQYTFVLQLGQ